MIVKELRERRAAFNLGEKTAAKAPKTKKAPAEKIDNISLDDLGL